MWMDIDFLFIFQHFYRFLLDIRLLFLYNQYAIFLKVGVVCYAMNEKIVYLYIKGFREGGAFP